MSRPLPLPLPLAGTSPEPTRPAGDSPAADAPLRGRVELLDPPMCCPTGLCVPGVDPALLAITRDLRWLEKQGVEVARVGLATEPDAFVANARVAGLLQAFGDGALPATLVNGVVLVHGRYPSREEVVAALRGESAPAPTRRPIAIVAGDAPGCEPGSGCC